MHGLLLPLILVGFCEAKSLLKGKACGAPETPLHSAYRCQSSLCLDNVDMFKAGTILEFYCQPGYVFAHLPGISICHRGEWRVVQKVLCKLPSVPLVPHSSNPPFLPSIPLIAAASVVLSALIFAVVLCVLVKPVPSRCGCARRVYETLEEPEPVVVEGGSPPGLPSYEEAVYGHMGVPLLPSRGLLPLVLSAQPELSGGIRVGGETLDADDPPPSYQEAVAEAENAPEREVSARWAALPLFPLER